MGLARAGMLAGYWAGVPAAESQLRGFPGGLLRRFVRYPMLDLPAEQVRWWHWAPALRRVSERLLPRVAAQEINFLACRLYDRWVARGLRLSDPPGAVIACEISALNTFRVARDLGISRCRRG